MTEKNRLTTTDFSQTILLADFMTHACNFSGGLFWLRPKHGRFRRRSSCSFLRTSCM